MLERATLFVLFYALTLYALVVLIASRCALFVSKLLSRMATAWQRHLTRDVFPWIQATVVTKALRLYRRG